MTGAPADSPQRVLRRLRAGWGGLILAELLLVASTLGGLLLGGNMPSAKHEPALFYLVLGLLIVLTPLGCFARNQIYKRCWRGHVITSRGYVRGNQVLLGAMAIVAVAAATVAWIRGQPLLMLFPAAGALLVQIANFPTGRPMRRTLPRLGRETKAASRP